MPLTAGERLGPYEIVAPLGAGGMGEVYRGRDGRLNRGVAIKIMPVALSGDAQYMARFEREAQVLASLNHPNIASIYGIEQNAIVMELVEGAELRGPLPEEQVLPVIHQLIDALEYAHEKGIVHRDLKPANIKITPQGRIKVLDFGLAKALSPDTAATADRANSPTLTMQTTVAGVILGTAAYMSPEQARGQEVDKRADVWSFGVVVYELLTGRTLFDHATISDTLAAVLRQEIDLANVPPRYRRMLRSCLERDPRRRLRDIGDARLLLEEPAPVATPASPKGSTRLRIAAAVATLTAAVLGVALFRALRPADRPLVRFSVELAPDAVGATAMTAAISPDGTRIAFRVRTPNGYTLATRLLDQPQATVLPGTELAYFAFFSPDSQWIGFFAGDKLKKVAVQGGAPVTICEASPPTHGATWLSDGTIVAVIKETSLVRVPASGGTPQRVGRDFQQLRRYPQALPGNDQILVTTAPQGTLNFDNAQVNIVSIKTGQEKTVIPGGYSGRYVPTGHLIYIRQGTLYGVGFDLASLETRGAAVPLLEDVSGAPGNGSGRFDFSLTGTLAYASGKPQPADQPLALLDSAGVQTPLNGAAGSCLRLSPDGQRLAYAANGDLSVYDLRSEIPLRVTFDPTASNRHPAWTPDGKYLAYAGNAGIWWTRSDGSGQPIRLLEGTPAPTPWSFTGGDTMHHLRLAFHRASGGQTQSRDIWILPLDLTDPDHPVPGKPELFLAGPSNETAPSISPDGRWMAYDVNDATPQIFVRRYRPGIPAGEGGRWLITGTGSGNFPTWGQDGKRLFYRASNGLVMVVDYTTSGDTFSPGRPREWSPTAIFMTGVFQNFDMFPDGRRAVVVAIEDKYKGGTIGQHATFLLNFFDEVKRRIPAS